MGVQGSEINYVEGYLESAKLLADMVVGEEMTSKRDTLIMPILYNARHGLELALKYAVTELRAMDLVQRLEGRADHHILRYWRHLADANVPDRVVREIITGLEPFAASLSRIDVDGQQLRDFRTADDRRSLEGQAVVHLPLIRRSVTQLSMMLGELTARLADMREQHSTGTRTTRCSRLDLAEIVEILGPHRTWMEDGFLNRKGEVMARFGLTKKAFSNSIDAIRKSRELAARLGIETELKHLDDANVLWLAERWLEVYPPSSPDCGSMVIRPGQVGLDEVERQSAAVWQLVTAVVGKLSLEECADVETIFYTGRNMEYGEYYESSLADTIRKYRQDRDRLLQHVNHVVSKTNLLVGLISGLRRVGRPSLAGRLADFLPSADRSA